jgi:enterochelin esterase family protein
MRITPILLWLAVSLLSGCGRKPAAPAAPATAPNSAQLATNRLFVFASQLKALPETERPAAAQRFLTENPATPMLAPDNLVGFFWYGNARTVSITGDLQGAWAKPEPLDAVPCGEDSFCYGIYQVPADARLDYLLVVDGKETTDPRNPRTTPSGYGPHSEIAMPQFKPTPARHFREGIPHGTLDSITFTNTPQPLKPRTLKVYKPPGLDASTRLPTLYVYDGLEALAFMEYTNVLDNLIADAKIQPVLIVFIEMLPDDIQLFPDKFPTLATLVCDELVPLIDRSYPTAAAAGSRGITGISVWGNLAFMTAFGRPDVFALAAGQSTTVNKQLVEACRGRSVKQAAAQWKVYLDVGNYDLAGGAIDNLSFLRANELFRDELKGCGINPRYGAYNDGHQWANWRERTEDILSCLFPPAGR